MNYIAFPACNDTTASAIFWIVILSCIAGKLVHSFLTKFDLYDELFRPYLTAVIVLGLSIVGLYYQFWSAFTGVAVDTQTITLHYYWPRAPIVLDATTIDAVGVDTNLRLYRPSRSWKHKLELSTNQGRDYESVDVCIPRNKVGTDYQSAIFTKLNDPVEKAAEAINLAVVTAKLTSAKAKSIDPTTYAAMFVRTLRKYRNIAADKDATDEQREQAMQQLVQLLTITKTGLGENHFGVSVVYRFIGSVYGYRGDLKNAKLMFAEADKRCYGADRKWQQVDDRINPNGLTLFDFEHPEGPRTPNTAIEY